MKPAHVCRRWGKKSRVSSVDVCRRRGTPTRRSDSASLKAHGTVRTLRRSCSSLAHRARRPLTNRPPVIFSAVTKGPRGVWSLQALIPRRSVFFALLRSFHVSSSRTRLRNRSRARASDRARASEIGRSVVRTHPLVTLCEHNDDPLGERLITQAAV